MELKKRLFLPSSLRGIWHAEASLLISCVLRLPVSCNFSQWFSRSQSSFIAVGLFLAKVKHFILLWCVAEISLHGTLEGGCWLTSSWWFSCKNRLLRKVRQKSVLQTVLYFFGMKICLQMTHWLQESRRRILWHRIHCKKTYAVETSWFPRIELSREWLQTGLKCLHSFHSFSSLCTLTSDADMIQRMKCDSLLKSPSWSTLFKTSCSLPLLTFFVSPLPAFYGLLKRVLLLLPSSTCPSLCYPCSLSSSLVPFFFLFQFLLLLEDCNVHVNCVLTTGHSTRKWLTYWTQNFL